MNREWHLGQATCFSARLIETDSGLLQEGHSKRILGRALITIPPLVWLAMSNWLRQRRARSRKKKGSTPATALPGGLRQPGETATSAAPRREPAPNVGFPKKCRNFPETTMDQVVNSSGGMLSVRSKSSIGECLPTDYLIRKAVHVNTPGAVGSIFVKKISRGAIRSLGEELSWGEGRIGDSCEINDQTDCRNSRATRWKRPGEKA